MQDSVEERFASFNSALSERSVHSFNDILNSVAALLRGHVEGSLVQAEQEFRTD
jgi:hypothetical protein